MATFTKFATAPDGRLVYRGTGNAVPSTYGYQVKGRTVYNKQGRKVGQLGKGTAKEQKRIKEKAKARQKKASSQAIKKVSDFAGLGGISESYQKVRTWRQWVARYDDYKLMDLEHKLKVKLIDVGKQNFARALEDLVNSGIISEEEASERFEEYLNAQTDKEQSEIWEEIKHEFKEHDWKYSDIDEPDQEETPREKIEKLKKKAKNGGKPKWRVTFKY